MLTREEVTKLKSLVRSGNQTEKSAKNKVGESQIIKVRIRKNKREEPVSTPLFSEKDVRRTVTEFVSAWLRGDIIIRFPTAAELSKANPFAIAFPTDPSVNQELKIKEHYVDQLLICAGITPASKDEQKNAVDEVYRMLLMFRSANRIEGKIMSDDLERRVVDLEKKLHSTNKLVEQITGFLFKEEKPVA